MNLKITKEINLTDVEVRDIIVRYLYDHHGLSGIFDVDFILSKKSHPHYITQFSAKVRISENE
jgi:hypothetical protein